jgi:hypothetical protein
MGRAPLSAYAPSERAPNHVGEAQLREALAVRERRRVRRDTTVSVLGCIYELQQGFLAGRVVDIVYSHLDDPAQPEVEHEGKRYSLHIVDPVGNSQRVRPLRHPQSGAPREPVVFDPSCALADGGDHQEDDDAND